MKIGSVLFDSALDGMGHTGQGVDLGSGWASVRGGAAARISSIHELPTDTIWLTNLSYSSLCHASLQSHPNFRSEIWLRTPVQQLMGELGVGGSGISTDIAAEVISEIGQSVIDSAERMHGVTPISAMLNIDFFNKYTHGYELAQGDLAGIVETITNHIAVTVVPSLSSEPTCGSAILRKNRLEHARHILSTPIPLGGSWHFEPAAMHDGNDQLLESIDSPFIAECTIKPHAGIIERALSWGSGASLPRSCITDIEWRMLRDYADIRIGGVHVYSRPGGSMVEVDKLPAGPHSGLSITDGLVAEQLWSCFLNRAAGGFNQKSSFLLCSAWLRSFDRMEMFRYAHALMEKGVDVMRYGNGNVVVKYGIGGLNAVIDQSLELGLMPPSSKFSELGGY